VTNTVSVGLSAGVEGIFSASFGYEFSATQSSSNTDQFTVPAGGVGEVTWTPIYRCFSGTFSGCTGDGDPADGTVGEMCTADKDGNGSVRGVTTFVALGKSAPPKDA
jgi:hypothetical protein